MVTWSWLDVAEVVKLSFGPHSLSSWGVLLSARCPSKKPFQMTGKQLAPSQVRVGVGCTELGVPALPTLGDNFSDRRLSSSFLKAVDSGLLPALLGFWLAGQLAGWELDVSILHHNNDI